MSARTIDRLMQALLKDIYARRELLSILVWRNIKIRYKGSVVGFFWTLLNPIFLIVIYAVFLGLLKIQVELEILVSGIIVWSFFDMCLGDALFIIIGNTNLIKKTAFPRVILPLSMVISNLVNFLLSLVVLGCYLATRGLIAPEYLPLLPLIIVTQAALCLGVSLIIGSLNVFFRDVEHLLGVLKLAWFFLTPVIYPLTYIFDKLPPLLQKLAFLNPMLGVVTAQRTAWMGTDLVAPDLVVLSLVVCWLVLAVGIVYFEKTQKRFADVL